MNNRDLYDKLVAKTMIDIDSGCWLWTGARWHRRKYAAHRYGYITIWNKEQKLCRARAAHRMMWISLRGDLPSNIHVCHRCDNPLCINPEHLFLGTHKDNMADSKRKGRHYLSSKTHCKRGHPLSGDNVYICKNGLRHCKACQRGRQRLKLGWTERAAFSA